jgi:hypothetical protein
MTKILKYKKFICESIDDELSSNLKKLSDSMSRLKSLLLHKYRIHLTPEVEDLFLEFIDRGWEVDVKSYNHDFYRLVLMDNNIKVDEAESTYHWLVSVLNKIKIQFMDMYKLKSHFNIKINNLLQNQDVNKETNIADIYSYAGIGEPSKYSPPPNGYCKFRIEFYIV